MLSNGMIGLFAGIAAAAWIFTKMQRRTGGLSSRSLVVAIAAGFFVFLLVYMVMGTIFKGGEI